MVKNRHGQNVEVDTISKIDETRDGYAIDRTEGWGTLFISKDECNGFVPQVGDAIIYFTTNLSLVHGIIIENHVIRYKTAKQQQADRQEMLDGFRLRKLEEYVKHGDDLKARAAALPSPFKERMERFTSESDDPVEFWVESAGYEMICLEGAAALLRKVGEVFEDEHIDNWTDEAKAAGIEWIENWWNMNTKEGGYDYKGQMEIVPDFGEGHSGFTASAAKSMAIAVLEGKPV
jgi:hypothetical protein